MFVIGPFCRELILEVAKCTADVRSQLVSGGSSKLGVIIEFRADGPRIRLFIAVFFISMDDFNLASRPTFSDVQSC